MQAHQIRILFSSRLRELRIAMKATQLDMANRLGIQQSAYARWENGVLPDAEPLVNLCATFNFSSDYLLGLDGDGQTDWKERALRAEMKLESVQEMLTHLTARPAAPTQVNKIVGRGNMQVSYGNSKQININTGGGERRGRGRPRKQ